MFNSKVKCGLLLSVALVGVLAAGPVQAQAQAQAQARTQTKVKDDSATGDIIVTARRTEERLQDVPISITVFNQQQVSNRNIILATDLATYTPSLSVNQQYGADRSTFAIRGFVQDQATAPSVGVYFADVTEPRVQGQTTSGNNAPAGAFVDLQSVQVLKGPQGTLFGRNTTGGAVLLVPQKPTDKLEGWVEGSAGDYGMVRGTAMLNVPLSETLKIRAVVDRQKRDGYMKNDSGIGPKAYNNLDYFAARISIIGDLTPNLENYTVATYNHSFDVGNGQRLVGCNPSAGGIGALLGPLACAQIAQQSSKGVGPLGVDTGIPDPYVRLKQLSFINTTTWKPSDNLTIKNIASYSEFREYSSFSLVGENFFIPSTPIPFQVLWLQPGPTGQSAGANDVTEELQFQGRSSNDRFIWQAGGYFENSRPNKFTTNYTDIFLSCTSPHDLTCANYLGFGQISAARTEYSFNTRGLYAQATYKLFDKLSATGGIRYTWDKITAIDESTDIQIPPSGGTPSANCYNPIAFPSPTNRLIGMTITNPSQCHTVTHNDSQKPTWLIDLDYKPSGDALIYAKYSRGYRAGGINLTDIGLETWNPEKVDAYEIGAKTSFHGRSIHGYLNIAGFYNNFTNQQLSATLVAKPESGLAGGIDIVNAGKSRIQGVELDGSATVLDQLRFDVGYTYLDTKLETITQPVLPADSPYSAAIVSAVPGSSLALSPKNRVSLTGTYTLPLAASVGSISVAATLVHTDKQTISLATLPQFQDIPVTNLVNVNVNWNHAFANSVDLSFFVTNLTNKIYPISVATFYYSFGLEAQSFAPPRMFGFRARYSFGQ